MALRTFLDGVLTEIDSESLTDDEYNSVDGDVVEGYNVGTYEALKAILQEREGVTGQLKRLQSFYIAKGVDLSGTPREASSQILVGVALE